MKNSILGIDPGLTGGLVVLDKDREIKAQSIMPVKNGRIDYKAVKQLCGYFKKRGGTHVILEQVGGWASDAAKSAFNFGKGVGYVEIAIEEAGLKFEEVRPVVWTKVLHEGLDPDLKPKAKSRIVIEELWPDNDFTKSDKATTPHEGIVDATLIAEWYRRQLYGSPPYCGAV